MFIAALFTIAKVWKLPKCPSGDEWIKQLWDIYTMTRFLRPQKIQLVKTYHWILMSTMETFCNDQSVTLSDTYGATKINQRRISH